MYYTTGKIATAYSTECTEYFTLFKERSCDDANLTEIKPIQINPVTWNASRFDWNPDYKCIDAYPSEECFFEITCERIETVCEKQLEESIELTTEIIISSSQTDMELLAPETTTVNTVECTEFYTIFEERSCDDSMEIKPALIDFKTWNISRFNSNFYNYCLGTYPYKECFFELTCERVETICERHVEESTESGLKNNDSDMSYYNTLIAIGVLSSVILLSLFLNYAASKYKDFIQSGTYRLPHSPTEIADSEL
ncbi:unnamed protein product [Parnassius apollo]|uniref:(apollo) hypothetical protein n=1 Tax=Parnassius apollo TaxID=110799 RepID=A0A8S3Y6Z2_PARAO|nr:unnamed protein product [Parnassius apollo]